MELPIFLPCCASQIHLQRTMPEPIGLEKGVGLHYNVISKTAVAATGVIQRIRRKKPKNLSTAKVRLTFPNLKAVYSNRDSGSARQETCRRQKVSHERHQKILCAFRGYCGSTMLPMNSTVPVALSRIAKKNG